MNCASLPPPLNPLNLLNPPNLSANFHSKGLLSGHAIAEISPATTLTLSQQRLRRFLSSSEPDGR